MYGREMFGKDITHCDGKNCSAEYKLCCERFIGNRSTEESVWMLNSMECVCNDMKLFRNRVVGTNNIKEAYEVLNQRMNHC